MSVSLKIKGNKFANEGLGIDLVAIGDPAFSVLDRQYPGAGNIAAFIVVRHTPGKSIYTLASTNVTSSDGSREGSMLVSVAVPTGEQVDGLYDMLISLTETYKSLYMTPTGNRFRFLSTKESPEAFANIINQHRVSHYPFRPIEMSGNVDNVAYLFLTPAQISQVLNDPMRSEFAPYGQVVLVPVANPEAYQSTFPFTATFNRVYRVALNGRMTTQTISDPDKVFTLAIGATATHEAAQISFSLRQARAELGDGVSVNDFNQTVSVRLVAKPKPIAPAEPKPERQIAQSHTPIWAWVTIAILAGALLLGVVAYLSGMLSPAEPIKEEQPAVEPVEPTDSLYNPNPIVDTEAEKQFQKDLDEIEQQISELEQKKQELEQKKQDLKKHHDENIIKAGEANKIEKVEKTGIVNKGGKADNANEAKAPKGTGTSAPKNDDKQDSSNSADKVETPNTK